MKLLNFDKVLCLSPHPDDVELSMAGTIKLYTETNFDVYCLTTGTSTDATSNEIRHSEVRNFWNEYSCENVNCFTSTIDHFESLNTAEWITYLDKIATNYDAIFTTSKEDSHQEHVFLNSLSYPLTRNRPISIIEYKSPSTLQSWTPNMFVQCNNVIEHKIDALRNSFKSQIDSIYFTERWLEVFHTNYDAMKKQYNFVETFKIVSLYK